MRPAALRPPDVSFRRLWIRLRVVSELDQLVNGRHADPHSLLGAHPRNGGVVVRAFRPSAEGVTVKPLDGSAAVDATLVHPAGLFEAEVPKGELPLAYELEVAYPD